ncbi:MAG: Cytochrome c [Gemmataceae bacterium]|nr:Cytochrome c [Gemmataceae bacterium]
MWVLHKSGILGTRSPRPPVIRGDCRPPAPPAKALNMTSTLLLLATLPAVAPQPVADLKVPPGFVASQYSDYTLANDIYTMTVDDAGRVLVAGPGYVRVLTDDGKGGRATGAVDLIDDLKDGPMGLFAEGESLYVVADGGLKRYRGYNGTDKLKGPPETLLAVKTTGEHEAHAVRRGPDGWLYLLCGNTTGVKKERIDPLRSPVKDLIAGCVLRISPDGKTVEVVADGFRNPYGFDFNPDGELFTYDSDNERCVGLPWYEPCRFYHVVPGGNYGWRAPQLSQTWRKPPYFADVVAPICYTGRGSPTGVACYRNTHFPEQYHGGFFLADWTFGRVYFVPLAAKGSTYTGKPEVFLEAAGENGFAPTALAVHPQTGDLFVSIGGRGTRGSVYRIHYEKGGPAKSIPVAKRSPDWDAEAAKTWRADAACEAPLTRRHALELMLRWREKLGWGPWLGDLVRPSLAHDDTLIRAAAGRLAVSAAAPVGSPRDPLARLTIALAEVNSEPGRGLAVALDVLGDQTASPREKLVAVRLLQLALGDLTTPDAVGTVWEGYTLRRRPPDQTLHQLLPHLRLSVGSPDPDLAREAARTLAALADPDPRAARMVLREKLDKDTDVLDDIHYLISLGRVQGGEQPDWAVSIADLLIDLDRKIEKQHLTRDRNWPLRVEEIATALGKKYPELGTYMLARDKFGRPDHLLFVRPLRIAPPAAARKFLAAAANDPEFSWSPGLVALLGSISPDEARPTLLRLWDQGGLEDAIIPVLAPTAKLEDRGKFITGLKSFDPEVVRVSAVALAKLPPPKTDPELELAALILALRRLPDDKSTAPVREAVIDLLGYRTGKMFAPYPKMWGDWFAFAYPKLADKLAGADEFDAAAWKAREAKIPWAAGDAANGRKAFAKATCAACHDGGRAVGPSLLGVSKRFGRDDLRTAVLRPNKDVSPRYRPTRITTTDGRAVVGMIVYEAVDGVILQTGPDTTVRLAGAQIESKRLLETSLMPAGLLDKLSDQEVADLFAYLAALDPPEPK